jgi:hypothetical protein
MRGTQDAHVASALQEGRKNANIYAGSGSIRRILHYARHCIPRKANWYAERAGAIMDNQPRQAKGSGPQTDDGESPSATWGLLVPLFYLALLACGVWLITWHYDALDDGRVQIAVAIVVLVALGVAVVLFVQQWKSGFVIDKRNYMDMTRFQWRKRIAQDWDESDRRGGG